MNAKNAKVLLIEDDPLYAQAIRGLFMAKGVAFDLEWANSLAKGLTRLAQGDVDIVLLDLALPDSEGLETFGRLHRYAPEVPIIVLTATNDDDVAIQAMQAGAQDYLVKGEINRHLLQRAMRYAIERQRAEAALRESQKLIQEIADVTPEIISIYDLEEQRTIYVNRQLTNILGYNTAQLERISLKDYVERSAYQQMLEIFERLRPAADGEVLELEYRARHANGEWRWLHSEHTVFTRNEMGGARQILITTHDVTERRQAEEALRRSEERYRDLVENSGLYVGTHDLEGRLLSVNKNVLDFLGLHGVKELAGRRVSDFVMQGEAGAFDEYLTTLLAKGRAHGTVRMMSPGGQVIVLEYDNTLRQTESLPAIVRCIGRDVTERMQATAAVRASEDRYRDLVENSGLLIGTHDVEGRLLSVNQSTLKFLGLEHESALQGRRISALLPAEGQEKFNEYLQRVVAEGRAQGLMRVRTPDGEEHLLEYDNSLRQDAPDQTGVIRYIARDVTERRRAEERIRESEERFRLIAKNSTDMIGRYSTTGEVLYASPALTRMLGYDPEERIGTSIYDLLHPDDVDNVRRAHRLLLERAGTQIITFRYRHQDGHYVWCETNARLITQPETGVAQEIIAITRDISERRAAEAALRESEERYRDLFENANDIVFTTDLQGRLTSLNQAGERLLGYTREEALATGDAVMPEFKRVVRQMLEERLRHGVGGAAAQPRSQQSCYEVAVTAKDRRSVILEISPRLITKHGKPSGVQGIARDVTERKLAEAAQRESEERYRDLFENAKDIVFTLDMEGRITSLNKAGERALGYQREDLLEHEFASIVARESQKFVPQMLERKATSEAPTTYEVEVLAKGGGAATFEISSRLINKEGRPIGVQAIAREVTERKRTDEERMRLLKQLEAERTLLQAVLRQMPAGVVIAEAPSERVILANEKAANILRQPVQEIRDLTRYKLFYLDGKRYERDQWPLLRSIRNGEFISGEEMYLQRSDGAVATVRVDSAPIRDQRTGRIVAGVLAFSDITERKLAEEQIREQAALLNCAQDAISVQDLEGRILFWNRGAERLYGWAVEEVFGQRIIEWIYPERQLRWLEEIKKKLEETGEWKGELRQLTKDKRELVVESRFTLVRDDAGRPKSILVINTDITGRKQLETQVLRMQRMESIGSLASGIAHDLNNALAPILMALHTLQQRFTDQNSQHWLSLIRKSAERSRDLVDQVLTFARGASGERLQLEVDELIKEMANILQETLPKNVKLKINLPQSLWPIVGDPTQIHQVLMNLCINARDAMPQGGYLTVAVENVRLTPEDVWLREEVKPGRFVAVTVTDTGTGMPSELVDRIFEPFFTTKEQGQGSGLGLSTASGIVRGHGGFINVFSEIGKGSQFKVYLPADESVHGDDEENHDPLNGRGELVLVVDDEPTLLEVTKVTLEGAGYRVLAVHDGQEALNQYRQYHQEIKIVLTDLAMPGMDGLAASQAMQTVNPNVKIIATSGLRSQENINEANKAGVKNILWKPYTADDLLTKIAEVIHAN